MEEKHTAAEWEKKIPFNVELRGMRLDYTRKVTKAVAITFMDWGNTVILYNSKGEAFSLYDPEEDEYVKEDVDVSLLKACTFLKTRWKEMDIKWE